MSQLLIIPRVKIQNANAVSSPYTIGFPAMTAWGGAVHALQFKLQKKYAGVTFKRFGIVSHNFSLQADESGFDRRLKLAKQTPTNKKSLEQFLAGGVAIIPEGRCHLTISLIIEYTNFPLRADIDNFKMDVAHQCHAGLKLAGGDILDFGKPKLMSIDEKDDGTSIKILMRSLMPGFALLERRGLMIKSMEKGYDAIDAMLDYLTIHHASDQNQQQYEQSVKLQTQSEEMLNEILSMNSSDNRSVEDFFTIKAKAEACIKEILGLLVNLKPKGKQYQFDLLQEIEKTTVLLSQLQEQTQSERIVTKQDLATMKKTVKVLKKLQPFLSVTWSASRKETGWIIPIATGFQAITDYTDSHAGQRDLSVPHRFAESVVTLGEFKMPYHLNKLDDLLWHSQVENDLYLYTQN